MVLRGLFRFSALHGERGEREQVQDEGRRQGEAGEEERDREPQELQRDRDRALPLGAGKAKPVKKSVIASRKSCSATGTGLSHYILTDRKAK